jgi:hypothetical protein
MRVTIELFFPDALLDATRDQCRRTYDAVYKRTTRADQ